MREAFNPERTFAAPGDDWIPLDRAPFYYGKNFIRSPEEWRPVIEGAVPRSLDGWAVDVRDDKGGRIAVVSGGGLRLELHAASGEMWLIEPGENFLDNICLFGTPDEFCQMLEAAAVGPHARAIELHYGVALSLCARMQTYLRIALDSGAARLMARKRSPLEPFSYIPLDQWHHFAPDAPATGGSLKPWYAPAVYRKGSDALADHCTASSPGGDRLFSVHVAPGSLIRSDAPADREKQCTQWLVEQLRQYPESYPGGRGGALAAACDAFPGLSENGFQRAYARAREQTGNNNWSRPGRPSKSLRLITSPK